MESSEESEQNPASPPAGLVPSVRPPTLHLSLTIPFYVQEGRCSHRSELVSRAETAGCDGKQRAQALEGRAGFPGRGAGQGRRGPEPVLHPPAWEKGVEVFERATEWFPSAGCVLPARAKLGVGAGRIPGRLGVCVPQQLPDPGCWNLRVWNWIRVSRGRNGRDRAAWESWVGAHQSVRGEEARDPGTALWSTWLCWGHRDIQ